MDSLPKSVSIHPPEDMLNAPVSFFMGTRIKGDDPPLHHRKLGDCLQFWEDPGNTSLAEETARLRRLKAENSRIYKRERSIFCPTYQIGKWNTRTNCDIYVPLLVFDIDGGDEATYLFNLSKCKEIPFIYRAMPSLGGGGRILVKCGSTPDTHKAYYKAISEQLGQYLAIPVKSSVRSQKKAGIEISEHIDTDTSAINQFWFACHTPIGLIYHNEESEIFYLSGGENPRMVAAPLQNDQGTIEALLITLQAKQGKRPQRGGYPVQFTQREMIESLVSQIEEQAEDITRGMTQIWFPKILLPLANEFRESGRDLAHRVSRFHSAYKLEETDKEFDRALAKDQNKVRINTFYALCKSFGYLVDFDRIKAQHSATTGHAKPESLDTETSNEAIDAEPDHPNLTVDREQNCYWWESTGKGKTKDRISNFLIIPHYLLQDSQEPKRIWELTNNRNESTVVCIPARYLAKQAEFTALVEGRGNFVPAWSGKQFSAIKEYLFPQEKHAEEVSVLGYQPATHHYAFARGIFDGQTYHEADEYGIVKVGEQLFYLPAYSRVNEQAEREYHNERKFLFEPGKTTFKAWSEQLVKVFGQNAVVGICFTVAALFRDLIYARANCFPILFLFGPRGTGKTTFRQALKRLFGNYGPNDAIGLGSASSPKGFARKLAQVRNGLEAFEEFKNRINPALIEMLKNIYDGIGYERAQTSNDNRTHATPVNSGVIVAGQEMPTKENALFSRVVLLSFSESSHSEEAKKEFRQLEQMIDQGLGNVLLEVILLREQMAQGFASSFDKVYSHLRKDPQTQHLEERTLTNVAALLAPFLVLSEHLVFPVDYKQAYQIFRERITSQAEQMNKTTEVNEFWQVFELLAARGEINNNFEYLKKQDTLYVHLTAMYDKYATYAKNTNINALDQATLECYLTMQTYFVRPQGEGERRTTVRVRMENGQQKRCLTFDLQILELEFFYK